VIEHQHDLATIMRVEQGKPLTESRGKIGYASSFLKRFAVEKNRVYDDTIASHAPDKRMVVTI
jgi:succinate-semialdehyde dehydrogenase/glutarate-semialdehyde dehydrogenase